MRIREILAEYDRSMTLKSWEQKLTTRMDGDESAPDSIDQLMEMIESADPTRNKIYAQWIVKRYVAGDFAADDIDQVNLRLTDYDSVKKFLTTGKDINQLTYAQLPDIITAGRSQKTAPKFETIPDTEVLYNGPDGQLAIPKTEEASRALGSGTAWCTAWTDRDTMFDHYNSSGNIYTWRAKNGNKFQFYWGDDIQFMNSANKPISPKDMHFFRSINPPTKQLFAKYEDKFLKSDNKKRILTLFNVLAKSQTVWEEGLESVASEPRSAFAYARMLDAPFPLGEPAIATNAEYSYEYAQMLDKPFPLGEPAIATNDEYSLRYALMVGKPFPLGEPAIATNDEYSYEYASMLGKRFPAGEPAIATSDVYSFNYAYMLGEPFPLGEKAIATSAAFSFRYANRVLGNKAFPLGEKAIATSSRYSFEYAEMLNKAFPLGEAEIATSYKYAYEYAKMLGKPFPAGEPAIATDARYSLKYATDVLGRRFPEGEEAIKRERRFYAKEYDEKFGTNLSQQ